MNSSCSVQNRSARCSQGHSCAAILNCGGKRSAPVMPLAAANLDVRFVHNRRASAKAPSPLRLAGAAQNGILAATDVHGTSQLELHGCSARNLERSGRAGRISSERAGTWIELADAPIGRDENPTSIVEKLSKVQNQRRAPVGRGFYPAIHPGASTHQSGPSGSDVPAKSRKKGRTGPGI